MSELKIYVIAIAALLGFALGMQAISSYFEMKSFNSCTGSNASFTDALFTDLRVLECHKNVGRGETRE